MEFSSSLREGYLQSDLSAIKRVYLPAAWSVASKSPRRGAECILGTKIVKASGSNDAIEAMEEIDSTEVKYKIRQWSLSDATIDVSSSIVSWNRGSQSMVEDLSILDDTV